MRLKDMSEVQLKTRKKFIELLEGYSWSFTEIHEEVDSGGFFYIDAQLYNERANRSTVSLALEYKQIIFEAEFNTFVLRLIVTNCDISHSRYVVRVLPYLRNSGEVIEFLRVLLSQDVPYSIGVHDDFQILSNETIDEFIELVEGLE